MNAPTTPETLEDLKSKFEKTKESLIEQWAEHGIVTPPTDKEVWGQLRARFSRDREFSMADDMEFFVNVYTLRIKLIDEHLKTL